MTKKKSLVFSFILGFVLQWNVFAGWNTIKQGDFVHLAKLLNWPIVVSSQGKPILNEAAHFLKTQSQQLHQVRKSVPYEGLSQELEKALGLKADYMAAILAELMGWDAFIYRALMGAISQGNTTPEVFKMLAAYDQEFQNTPPKKMRSKQAAEDIERFLRFCAPIHSNLNPHIALIQAWLSRTDIFDTETTPDGRLFRKYFISEWKKSKNNIEKALIVLEIRKIYHQYDLTLDEMAIFDEWTNSQNGIFDIIQINGKTIRQQYAPALKTAGSDYKLRKYLSEIVRAAQVLEKNPLLTSQNQLMREDSSLVLGKTKTSP